MQLTRSSKQFSQFSLLCVVDGWVISSNSIIYSCPTSDKQVFAITIIVFRSISAQYLKISSGSFYLKICIYSNYVMEIFFLVPILYILKALTFGSKTDEGDLRILYTKPSGTIKFLTKVNTF